MFHQLRGPSLLVLGALSISCGPRKFGLGEGRDCAKGTLNCVCDTADRCDAPLSCKGDLCIAPESTKTDTLTNPNSNSSGSASGSGSQSSQSSGIDTSPECASDVECPKPEKPCYQAVCQQGSCFSHMMPDQSPCADPKRCIAQGSCQQGLCQGQEARFLAETFAQGQGKWRMDSPGDQRSIWAVGSAKASDCDDALEGEDPSEDHSEGEDNKLAGTQIGGCIKARSPRKWDCLVSPKMDISSFNGKLEFSYWRHLHSPPFKVQGQKGARYRVFAVFNGKTPVIVEEGYDAGINDKSWKRISHTLDADDSSMIVSFCFETGYGARSFAGWSLDDIRVRMQGCDEGL